jgi:hypothetical protein
MNLPMAVFAFCAKKLEGGEEQLTCLRLATAWQAKDN